HESNDAGFRAAIDPIVDGASLHEDVAGIELHDYAVVQLHVDRAGDDHGIVDRVGPVIARGHTALVSHNAENRSIFDRSLERTGRRIMESVIVDGKSPGRPDNTGRSAGPVRDDVFGEFINLDFGPSVSGVPGHDTANLQTHCRTPQIVTLFAFGAL